MTRAGAAFKAVAVGLVLAGIAVFIAGFSALAQQPQPLLPDEDPEVAAVVRPAAGDLGGSDSVAGPGDETRKGFMLLDGTPEDEELAPFGSHIFANANLADSKISINNSYEISPGDRIAVKIWGARTYEDIQPVDLQGNIFLPEVGPIHVGGLSNSSLNGKVKAAVAKVFTSNVQVYTNLLSSQPIGIYVTGAVVQPGRYPGSKSESILYYLARAGAIDPKRGSYRNIRVLRDGAEVATIDLYRFLYQGELPKIEFNDDDTILVGPQYPTIAVTGEVKNAYKFEFDAITNQASYLLKMAHPEENASHALVRGVREGAAYSAYVSIDELGVMHLRGGDEVTLVKDRPGDRLIINVVGNSSGPSSFAVQPGTSLGQVVRLIETDPAVADLDAIHIRRKSVAKQQKDAIQRSLYELQRSVLTASFSSSSESLIRIQEAKLVDSFVSKVLAVEPQGRVVVSGTNLDNIPLEDEDEIIIPAFTDVVLISGEVRVPQSLAWQDGASVSAYIDEAGGLSNRGDSGSVIVVKRDGSVDDGSKTIGRGDHIMIMPRDDVKYFAMFKDLVEVVFRVAVSAAVILDAVDDN